jgi:hypothetical protein
MAGKKNKANRKGKPARTGKVSSRKRTSSKTNRARKKSAVEKTKGQRSPAARRGVAKKKRLKKVARRKAPVPQRRTREEEEFELAGVAEDWGLGPESGGQAGDTEGLSRAEIADSESVEELIEEGQAFEAGVVGGIEDAPDADEGEIKTREVPEDDVPEEYLDEQ